MKKYLKVAQRRGEGKEETEMREKYQEKMCEEDIDYPKSYKEWVDLVNYRRKELGLSKLHLLSNNKDYREGKENGRKKN